MNWSKIRVPIIILTTDPKTLTETRLSEMGGGRGDEEKEKTTVMYITVQMANAICTQS